MTNSNKFKPVLLDIVNDANNLDIVYSCESDVINELEAFFGSDMSLTTQWWCALVLLEELIFVCEENHYSNP